MLFLTLSHRTYPTHRSPVQGGPTGLISSTVIDFRVGRILGVAFVGTVGDHERMDLATEVGLALEKRIVRIALGGG